MVDEYLHGVFTAEDEQSITAPEQNSMVQVAIGTAPVNLLGAAAKDAVNVPILCESYEDCVKKLGYSKDFESYTLCQTMYESFVDMKVGPVAFINVLDPSKHKKDVEETEKTVTAKMITLETGVLLDTITVKNGESELEADKDYFASFNSDGAAVIAIDSSIEATTLKVAYSKLDPSMVTTEDIIGAYDTETEKRTGIELIKDIFPRLRVIPLILTVPKYSTDDTVGAALGAKTEKINGTYTAMAICDLDTTTAVTRAKAIAEKKERTVIGNTAVCWPMIKKGGRIISYSAVLSALIMKLAADTEGFTCQSPSNKSISIDDCCLSNGTSVFMDEPDGNELCAQGIVTIINRNGWKTWGNNMACYPDNTKVKDRFIMSRLSMNWLRNNFINTNAALIDERLTKRIVDDIINDYNIRLSAFAAKEYILGGKISFNSESNTKESIVSGQFVFDTQIAPNIPMEAIKNTYTVDIDEIRNAIVGGEDNNE